MHSRTRKFQRYRYRIGCEFVLDGASNPRTGIVSELSACGVFVLSTIPPTKGEEIELVLREPSLGELRLLGRVAWARKTNRSAKTAHPSGFAVAIENAPESYFELISGFG